jgi:hypothetical protein
MLISNPSSSGDTAAVFEQTPEKRHDGAGDGPSFYLMSYSF